jgi:hypothetical protein
MGLPKVSSLYSLQRNVEEYQRCAAQLNGGISFRQVRSWYYVPALEMVAPGRFIGYENMTGELYASDIVVISAKQSEKHIQAKGWFEPLLPQNPAYKKARRLAENMSKRNRVMPRARFYVLKNEYDRVIEASCSPVMA